MDEDDHPLEVEEGIAGENASVERDMRPLIELQDPGVTGYPPLGPSRKTQTKQGE
jgi:hypothetical protein